MSRTHKLSGKGEAVARADAIASLHLKHSMAVQHFATARFFAERANEVEMGILDSDSNDETEKSQHRAFIIGSIISSVMALEAYINATYLRACDGDKTNLAGLDEHQMDLLAEWWPHLEKTRADTLLKYQHALLLLEKSPIPKGRTPYQDADNLIRLRNALTHYKPEWDDALDIHETLEDRLTGKFALNPLAGKNALWFPHQCLGSGCAKWAVSTTEGFQAEFCTRLGIAIQIPLDTKPARQVSP